MNAEGEHSFRPSRWWERTKAWLAGIGLPIFIASFVSRLLLAALVALPASEVFGLLCCFATYKYAWYYGVRIPFEEIPFLAVFWKTTAVSFVALAIVVGLPVLLYLELYSFLCKSVVPWIATWIYAFYSSLFDLLFQWRLTPPRRYAMQAEKADKILSGAHSPPPIVVLLLLGVALGVITGTTKGITTGICVTAFGWLATFAYFFRAGRILLTLAVVMWFCAIVTYITVLQPPVFADVLRMMGYGGGLHVEVETEGGTIDSHLVLRTEDSIHLLDSGGKIVEHPMDKVKSIRAVSGRLRSQDYRLPD